MEKKVSKVFRHCHSFRVSKPQCHRMKLCKRARSVAVCPSSHIIETLAQSFVKLNLSWDSPLFLLLLMVLIKSVTQQKCKCCSEVLTVICLFSFGCLSANPLLINSSMQPDLTVSRTYTSPMCFQDSIDKELMAERSLLDPLPDLKVKGQRVASMGSCASNSVLLLKVQYQTQF